MFVVNCAKIPTCIDIYKVIRNHTYLNYNFLSSVDTHQITYCIKLQ